MKDKKVLIVGHIGVEPCSLTALRIAELKAKHPDMIVVDAETAKNLGLSQSYEFKAPPKLTEPIILPQGNYIGFNHKSSRAMRREAERKSKKKR